MASNSVWNLLLSCNYFGTQEVWTTRLEHQGEFQKILFCLFNRQIIHLMEKVFKIRQCSSENEFSVDILKEVIDA